MPALFPSGLRPFCLRHAAFITCLSIGALAQSTDPAPVYRWITLVGRASLGVEDGPAADARFNNPHGLAMDLTGNLFVADTGNHTIRKITPAGLVSTLAGKAGQMGNSDGAGPNARFNYPQGVAVDRVGNVYVADTGNYTIRKITPTGIVTTVAGQSGIKGTADGPASLALFDVISQLSVDTTGSVYVADYGIRKISGGTVSTLLTQGQIIGSDGQVYTIGAGSSVAVDSTGQIYFSAGISPSPLPWFSSSVLGVVKMDVAGGLSFAANPSEWADPGYRGRSIGPMSVDASGIVSFFAAVDVYYGTLYPDYSIGPAGFTGGGGGVISSAGWPDQPLGLARDPSGNLYYTRTSDDVILKNGSTYAGTAWSNRGVDGTGSAARLSGAGDLAFDSAGNLWGADQIQQHIYDNHGGSGVSLIKITPTGTLSHSTIAEPNLVTSTFVAALTTDGSGNVYYATYEPSSGYKISKFAADGNSTAIPPYTQWAFNAGLVSNATGNLIMTDGLIHLLTPSGWVVLAGNTNGDGIIDGNGDAAHFSQIIAATADRRQGNFYILDYKPGANLTGSVCHLRQITTAGSVSTISRNLVLATGLGGIQAEMSPQSLAVDSHGTFFVLYPDNTVRQITANGDPVVIGGASWFAGSLDGNGNQALFFQSTSLAVDERDNLYVADAAGTTIRKGQYLGTGPKITTQPQNQIAASGSTAQFTVAAISTPAPTYQWFFGSTALSGATGTSLGLVNVRGADAGDYTVIVTNSLGSVTSNKATLTVGSAPAPAPAPTPAGGGGAISGWFVLALLGLGAARSRALYFRSK